MVKDRKAATQPRFYIAETGPATPVGIWNRGIGDRASGMVVLDCNQIARLGGVGAEWICAALNGHHKREQESEIG